MKIKVLYATYPWAFHVQGGGEYQIRAYISNVNDERVKIVKHNPWEGIDEDIDVVHFFSCIGGSVHFCKFV